MVCTQPRIWNAPPQSNTTHKLFRILCLLNTFAQFPDYQALKTLLCRLKLFNTEVVAIIISQFADHVHVINDTVCLSPSLGWNSLTDIESGILFTSKIIYVGDPKRLNRRLPNSPQDISQEDIDPHGQVGVTLTT